MLLTTIDGITVFIDGCFDCPFWNDGIMEGECKYPTKRKPTAVFERGFDDFRYFNGYPEDCPLRIGVKDEDKMYLAKDEIIVRKRAARVGFFLDTNFYRE